MPDFSLFHVAGSAMAAQSQRLNAIASNMANADSVAGPDGKPYQARQVVFEYAPLARQANQAATALAGMNSSFTGQTLGQPLDQRAGMGGVQVSSVVLSDAPARKEYRPDHPLADEQGYVSFSNVDPIAEMVDMIAASKSYEANVEVFNTSKSLLRKTLTLGE
ncbi:MULTISPECIES: flagellar basal body rod protein FlgC [Cobetia]|uniref:flagellar basal body rod protein FlgC n=1 Tax=Cobetia TaxID=204286 RepID=UPI0009864C93|nr:MULTISPECIES: flagellar basal body rod protein FlgC [Cobetia]POR06367.1 flagellar basal body rod protein FlgC [Cobetia sp. MM1IDA2H-1]